ncbi:MAG: DUF1553 domain-containing protein [bacterium]|nr:DUF1553 domain-containing protein [bacterium]
MPLQIASAKDEIDFNRDIRPILSDACFACHGPDDNARATELRLDTRDGMFADLGGYQAIVPGDPGGSLLLQRILSQDEGERMPPPESHKSLNEQQINLLRNWIAGGADYQEHWAFRAPSRPEIPHSPSASSDEQTWGRNEIDAFVLQRLKREGLNPAQPARREDLIRRVTLDLTGLPPTLQEIDDFVHDESTNAYEKVVDRLLQSKHYGEHMARYWLDAARYGDTHGLHLDNYREMWPYRDWVIEAFNGNMPFDQFVIEQLAGDLLPEPSLSQQIATGFNRAHVTTNEGGTIAEEFYVRNVVDRVDTFGQVFMGLTVGCAVCHDHKYDPITQQEYYQLFAFFNSIDGSPMDGNVKDHAPFVYVPSEEQILRQRELLAQREALETKHGQRGQEVEDAFRAWLGWQRQLLRSGSKVALASGEAAGLQLQAALDARDGDKIALEVGKDSAQLKGEIALVAGKLGQAVEFRSEDASVSFGDVAKFKKADSFSIGAWVRTPGDRSMAAISKMDQASNTGYEIELSQLRVRGVLARAAPDLAMSVVTEADVLKPNQWHHVLLTYDGSKSASGIAVYVDGKRAKLKIESDQLGEYDFQTSKPLQIGRRDQQAAGIGGAIDDLRIYDRALSDSEVAQLALAAEIEAILMAGDQLSDQQERTLRDYYLTQFDSVYQTQVAAIQALREQETALKKEMPTTLVFKEREKIRTAYVLERGEYDHQGQEVERNTPAVFPPLDASLPKDRLGLAHWLISPEHPLTSRVAVNRFWQQLFGVGLVKTSEDFGSQGEPPSHPGLLDWLAVEFRESAWDVKRLMKQMVMSSTYRQASTSDGEKRRVDPENRLLSRGPRFRLDAEMLRDQALAVSGLLVTKLGGPSVKPPQPDGLWFAVGYSGSNTVRFEADQGPDKVHRRTLYTFIKRTAPPPQMSTFDAPSREACTLRRERTNTPLQALLLLNDIQYVEAARGLALRVLAVGSEEKQSEEKQSAEQQSAEQQREEDDRSKLERMYRWCTARKPSTQVMRELESLLQYQREAYLGDSEAAQALISNGGPLSNAPADPGELAAWTMVANVVLNLDEVVCKN